MVDIYASYLWSLPSHPPICNYDSFYNSRSRKMRSASESCTLDTHFCQIQFLIRISAASPYILIYAEQKQWHTAMVMGQKPFQLGSERITEGPTHTQAEHRQPVPLRLCLGRGLRLLLFLFLLLLLLFLFLLLLLLSLAVRSDIDVSWKVSGAAGASASASRTRANGIGL